MTTYLDFSVFDTHNCKTLGLIDTSFYEDGQTISDPKVTVYIPGDSTPVEVGFLARKVNILNSNNLNITCADNHLGLVNLPDGIYKVKYTIKPDFIVEKVFMRTCRLSCRFDKALLRLDVLSCDDTHKKQLITKLRDIEFFIQSSDAATNVCNYELANLLYRRADEELDRLDINNC